MTTSTIRIGSVYAMKVGKNTVGVRIMSQDEKGGYIGININTNKEVIIRSPDRLCGLYNPKAGKKPATPAHVEKTVAAGANDTTSAKEPRQGGLTGAVKVLEEAGQPLGCQQMVEQMFEKGYWKTDGKTPAATIYSAIIREIKEKGAASRFRKTERGKFELAK